MVVIYQQDCNFFLCFKPTCYWNEPKFITPKMEAAHTILYGVTVQKTITWATCLVKTWRLIKIFQLSPVDVASLQAWSHWDCIHTSLLHAYIDICNPNGVSSWSHEDCCLHMYHRNESFLTWYGRMTEK